MSFKNKNLPYTALQNIASFLNISDRYSFGQTCVQIFDAVDTNVVWLSLLPPDIVAELEEQFFTSNTTTDEVTRKKLFHRECADAIVQRLCSSSSSASCFPFEEALRTETVKKTRVAPSRDSLSTSTTTVRTEPRIDPNIIEKFFSEDHSLFRSDVLIQLQVKFASYFLPRTCEIFSERHDLAFLSSLGGADGHRFKSSVSDSIGFGGELVECVSHVQLDKAFTSKKFPLHEEKRLLGWFKAISQNDIKYMMKYSVELRSAPLEMFGNTSLMAVLYGAYISVESHLLSWKKLFFQDAPEPQAPIWWDQISKQVPFLFDVKQLKDASWGLCIHSGLILFNTDKFEQDPSREFATEGLFLEKIQPKLLIGTAIISGLVASYQGGRLPSLHPIIPKYAKDFALPYKYTTDILSAVNTCVYDELMLFTFAKVVPFISSFTSFFTSIGWMIAAENPVSFFTQELIKFVLRSLFPDTVKSVSESEVWSWRTHVAEVFESIYAVYFGSMSKTTVASILYTCFDCVKYSEKAETSRSSFDVTVTTQDFAKDDFLLASSSFNISLCLLRWRLYLAGYGFYQTIALEGLIRMGLSSVEFIMAKFNKLWNPESPEMKKYYRKKMWEGGIKPMFNFLS